MLNPLLTMVWSSCEIELHISSPAWAPYYYAQSMTESFFRKVSLLRSKIDDFSEE